MKKCREELDIVFVPRVPARRPGVAVWRGGLARERVAQRLSDRGRWLSSMAPRRLALEWLDPWQRRRRLPREELAARARVCVEINQCIGRTATPSSSRRVEGAVKF